jgi:hypothetical protein
MEISEIKPIATSEKITPMISAEKNGKLRVTYPGWDDHKSVPFGHRLRGDFIGDPDLGRGSPIGDPDVLGRASGRKSSMGGCLIDDPGGGRGPWSRVVYGKRSRFSTGFWG